MGAPVVAPVVDVDITAPQWRAALPDAAEQCRRIAAAALGAAEDRWPVDRPERLEVSVLLADDATLRGLNRDWRGIDAPTNVLSFPALDGAPPPPAGPVPLGDVAVAFETVAREAAAAGRSIPQHLAHMIVHGVLHLLGHDHEDEADAEDMERLETAVLAALGVPDPYCDDAGDNEHRPLRQ